MLRSRLLALTFPLCFLGVGVSASERVTPPDAKTAPQAGAHSDLTSTSVPAPVAAEPAPPPSALADFAREFADRLGATQGRLSAADRADRAALAQFYAARANEPVWTTPVGLSPAAETVLAEIGRADDWGLDASAFRLPSLSQGIELTREQRADADIALSLAVLKYARHARGGRAEPLSLSKNLDRNLQLLDPQAVIEAATRTDSPDAFLRSLHPQHPQFERLRQLYLALKRGEPAPVEQVVRRDGKSPKHGSPKAPAGPSLRTLLVNMEQWRWMPDGWGDFYVWVNIPEYTVRVVKSGQVIHSERVIVGRTNTPTPVFSDEMKQVIFHPFWGVPDSIKQNELLPSLARGNTGVLERNGLRVQYRGRDIDPGSVDWSKVDMRKFHVYQPPGSGNVLGVVKFRFPNKHDVYMHDTPSKSLFNASVRTFSHGCMRVRDPVRLAEIVLAEDRGWPSSRVTAAVRSGPKDNQINLVRKVPVHMTYFTAWVEDDGKLRIYGDIYGHENRIALGMSGKSHLIQREREQPAPKVRERQHHAARVKERVTPPRQTVSTSGRTNNRGWVRGVFQN